MEHNHDMTWTQIKNQFTQVPQWNYGVILKVDERQVNTRSLALIRSIFCKLLVTLIQPGGVHRMMDSMCIFTLSMDINSMCICIPVCVCTCQYVLHAQVYSLHSCVNMYHFTPRWIIGLWSSVFSAHLHEVRLLHGVEQADPQMFPFVVHGDHVKGYCLWHSEDDG